MLSEQAFRKKYNLPPAEEEEAAEPPRRRPARFEQLARAQERAAAYREREAAKADRPSPSIVDRILGLVGAYQERVGGKFPVPYADDATAAAMEQLQNIDPLFKAFGGAGSLVGGGHDPDDPRALFELGDDPLAAFKAPAMERRGSAIEALLSTEGLGSIEGLRTGIDAATDALNLRPGEQGLNEMLFDPFNFLPYGKMARGLNIAAGAVPQGAVAQTLTDAPVNVDRAMAALGRGAVSDEQLTELLPIPQRARPAGREDFRIGRIDPAFAERQPPSGAADLGDDIPVPGGEVWDPVRGTRSPEHLEVIRVGPDKPSARAAYGTGWDELRGRVAPEGTLVTVERRSGQVLTGVTDTGSPAYVDARLVDVEFVDEAGRIAPAAPTPGASIFDLPPSPERTPGTSVFDDVLDPGIRRIDEGSPEAKAAVEELNAKLRARFGEDAPVATAGSDMSRNLVVTVPVRHGANVTDNLLAEFGLERVGAIGGPRDRLFRFKADAAPTPARAPGAAADELADDMVAAGERGEFIDPLEIEAAIRSSPHLRQRLEQIAERQKFEQIGVEFPGAAAAPAPTPPPRQIGAQQPGPSSRAIEAITPDEARALDEIVERGFDELPDDFRDTYNAYIAPFGDADSGLLDQLVQTQAFDFKTNIADETRNYLARKLGAENQAHSDVLVTVFRGRHINAPQIPDAAAVSVTTSRRFAENFRKAVMPGRRGAISPDEWVVDEFVVPLDTVLAPGHTAESEFFVLTDGLQDARFLDDAAKVAPPPRQIGAQQAGLGIGEAPTQGQLLPETIGEGGAVPLIDPAPLAAQAARREEIARGQVEMPMAPAAQAIPEPVAFADDLPTGLADDVPDIEREIMKADQEVVSLEVLIEERKRVVRPKKSMVTVSRGGKTRKVVGSENRRENRFLIEIDKLTTPQLMEWAQYKGLDPTQPDWYDVLDPQEAIEWGSLGTRIPTMPQLRSQLKTARLRLKELEQQLEPEVPESAIDDILERFKGEIDEPPLAAALPEPSAVEDALTRFAGPRARQVPPGTVSQQVPLSATPEAPNLSARLPESMKKSAPRFRFASGTNYIISFESDLDRALYIISRSKKRSKADLRFVRWVKQQTGMSESEARAAGMKINTRIKAMARKAPPGNTLRIWDTKSALSRETENVGGIIRATDSTPARQVGGATRPPGGGGDQPPLGGDDVFGAGADGPPPTPVGIERIASDAEALRKVDKPGAVTRFFRKGRGWSPLRLLLNYERAAGENPAKFTRAMIGQDMANAELSQRALVTRHFLLEEIDTLFGPEVKLGGEVNARFLGTAEQAAAVGPEGQKLTGTFVDVVDNPELYDLNPAQKDFISRLEARNDEFLNLVNEDFGGEIAHFDSKPGGAFLSHVDASAEGKLRDDQAAGLFEGTNRVSLGNQEERVWDTARERLANDPRFFPETDISKLLNYMDEAKIRSAKNRTLIEILDGKTEAELIEAGENMRDWKLVEEVKRFFPAQEAEQLQRALEKASTRRVARWIDSIRGGVLTGDTSPMTGIQMPLSLFFDPLGGSKSFGNYLVASVKGDPLRPFKMSEFIKDIAAAEAKGDQSFYDFFRFLGRSVGAGRPEELANSWLEAIPRIFNIPTDIVSKGVKKANDAMYLALVRRMKGMWDGYVLDFEKMGASHQDAMALAIDRVTKDIPQIQPSRLGQSKLQAQMARLPFNSVSFIRKPIESDIDFARAVVKIMTKRTLDMKDKQALKATLRMAVTVQGISMIGAMIFYHQKGLSLEKAAARTFKETLPGGKYFMTMTLPNGWSVPIGGPHRSLMVALAPGYDTPFERLSKWAWAKVGPVPSVAVDQLRNKDFFGHAIRPDSTSGLENVLRFFAYIAEGFSPLTAGEFMRGQRLDLPIGGTALESASQFLGSGLRVPSELNNEAARMFRGEVAQYSELDERFLKDLVVGSPNIQDDLAREDRMKLKFDPASTRGIIARLNKRDDERLQDLFDMKEANQISWANYRRIEDTANGARTEITQGFDDDGEEPTDPLDIALDEYNAVLADPESYNFKRMTDEAGRKLDAIRGQYERGSDEYEYISRNTNRRPMPNFLYRSAIIGRRRGDIRESIEARERHLTEMGRAELIPQMREYYLPTQAPSAGPVQVEQPATTQPAQPAVLDDYKSSGRQDAFLEKMGLPVGVQ